MSLVPVPEKVQTTLANYLLREARRVKPTNRPLAYKLAEAITLIKGDGNSIKRLQVILRELVERRYRMIMEIIDRDISITLEEEIGVYLEIGRIEVWLRFLNR